MHRDIRNRHDDSRFIDRPSSNIDIVKRYSSPSLEDTKTQYRQFLSNHDLGLWSKDDNALITYMKDEIIPLLAKHEYNWNHAKDQELMVQKIADKSKYGRQTSNSTFDALRTYTPSHIPNQTISELIIKTKEEFIKKLDEMEQAFNATYQRCQNTPYQIRDLDHYDWGNELKNALRQKYPKPSWFSSNVSELRTQYIDLEKQIDAHVGGQYYYPQDVIDGRNTVVGIFHEYLDHYNLKLTHLNSENLNYEKQKIKDMAFGKRKYDESDRDTLLSENDRIKTRFKELIKLKRKKINNR
jgi:hypothetical protein